MSEALMWDVATPHGFFRTITHAVGTGYIPTLEEFGGSQTPIGEIFTSWHSPRPSLYIGSSLPPMSRSDSQTDSLVMEFQQRQMGYISSFRENMPPLDDPAPNNPSDGNSCDNYSSFASTPPSSDGSSCAGSNIAPSPVSYRSTSLTADHLPTSPYISPLDVIVHGPPHVDGSSSGCPPQLPTVADRLEAMSPISQRIFMSCGSDPVVQSAVLDVLESPELMAKMAIRWEMAEPLLEKVMYGNVTDGKGKRGAPEFYKCRWGSCSEKMRRRLHALEHIMTHVNNRSHICSYCGKGFVRKNELTKHSPCKVLKRKLRCIDREMVVTQFDSPIVSTSQNNTTQFQFRALSAPRCPSPPSVVPGISQTERDTYPLATSRDAQYADVTPLHLEPFPYATFQVSRFSYAQSVRETTAY